MGPPYLGLLFLLLYMVYPVFISSSSMGMGWPKVRTERSRSRAPRNSSGGGYSGGRSSSGGYSVGGHSDTRFSSGWYSFGWDSSGGYHGVGVQNDASGQATGTSGDWYSGGGTPVAARGGYSDGSKLR